MLGARSIAKRESFEPGKTLSIVIRQRSWLRICRFNPYHLEKK
ncbi:hypothetical protein ACVJGD_008455 [Bradyrhizobium sp. USDA 10063]